MQIIEGNKSPAPDWSLMTREIECPLCSYNLRGLVEPRCPECGFSFTWHELIDAQGNLHPYLFEHHPKRNVWSFFKTYWEDCKPRNFWKSLSPAHAISTRRLFIYWVIANGTLLLLLLAPIFRAAGVVAQVHASGPMRRLTFNGIGGNPRFIFQQMPGPVPPALWTVAGITSIPSYINWQVTALPAIFIFLLWPALSFLALSIFQWSMFKANVKQSHIARCVVYSCDFGLLVTACALPMVFFADEPQPIAGAVLVVCPLVATYRLWFAYRNYLRFHMPFLTVATSQFIVFLSYLAGIAVIAEWFRW